MNYEKKIKVQAWVDGQMPAHEAARVADWVETDSEARELAEELRSVKVLLQIGEKPVKVEDSRLQRWAHNPGWFTPRADLKLTPKTWNPLLLWFLLRRDRLSPM